MTDNRMQLPATALIETAEAAHPVRDPLFAGISGRIHASVRRRTPFLSETAAKELAEDITENLAAYLKSVFTL